MKDLAELLELFQKRDVALVSVAESLDTGSAAGRLVMNIMASVAQWEREAIAERTATALRHKRARRQVYNHEPYGYARNGNELTIRKIKIDAEVEIVADDGETGKHANRPGLQRVLELVRRGQVEVVIVAKLDRLTRSVKDLAELLELFQKRDSHCTNDLVDFCLRDPSIS